jgi:DNA-binding Xre family transcriptional regulator
MKGGHMIATHINEICLKRGIETAYQLQKAMGIHPSPAYALFNDSVKMISLETLDRLCKVLKTTPAKLLTFDNSEKE